MTGIFVDIFHIFHVEMKRRLIHFPVTSTRQKSSDMIHGNKSVYELTEEDVKVLALHAAVQSVEGESILNISLYCQNANNLTFAVHHLEECLES